MSVKKRKCKYCKSYHLTESGVKHPIGWFCSTAHAIKFASEERERKAKKAMAKAKASKTQLDKQERAKIKLRKEKLKTAGDYIKEAQAAVNRYIRARDAGQSCISCGGISQPKLGGTMEAGHYRSRGSAGHLRFNVLNIHLQCARCNRYLSGNIVDYRPRLIDKIGLELVEQLECNNKPKKFTIDYLKRIKKIFSKRARFYEKRG